MLKLVYTAFKFQFDLILDYDKSGITDRNEHGFEPVVHCESGMRWQSAIWVSFRGIIIYICIHGICKKQFL